MLIVLCVLETGEVVDPYTLPGLAPYSGPIRPAGYSVVSNLRSFLGNDFACTINGSTKPQTRY